MDLFPTKEDIHVLFLQIAEGDESAFTKLFETYVQQLGAFVRNVTHSERIVEEVIQETFLRVWINRDKLPDVREPKAWLFRIVANLCYTWRNRLMLEEKAKATIYRESPYFHDDVTEELHLNALKSALNEAVGLLSPQRGKIYRLNRDHGLTVAEIAAELSLSPQTVRNTLSSSMEFVREHLQKKGYSLVVLSLLFRIF